MTEMTDKPETGDLSRDFFSAFCDTVGVTVSQKDDFATGVFFKIGGHASGHLRQCPTDSGVAEFSVCFDAVPETAQIRKSLEMAFARGSNDAVPLYSSANRCIELFWRTRLENVSGESFAAKTLAETDAWLGILGIAAAAKESSSDNSVQGIKA